MNWCGNDATGVGVAPFDIHIENIKNIRLSGATVFSYT